MMKLWQIQISRRSFRRAGPGSDQTKEERAQCKGSEKITKGRAAAGAEKRRKKEIFINLRFSSCFFPSLHYNILY
ncbi:MAG: hypothetical protein LUG64_06495 [Clostridiales bacterium]|nr:hypothetical protein [Clostridiales bacterium]